jgi:hypothetical protein
MKKSHKQIVFIFLLVLSIRLFFAFSTPTFTGDEAYHNIRQIENIVENGVPMFYDPLSQDDKLIIFPPLFYYVLALFNIFMPLTLVAKIIPNIFASTIVLIIYAISLEIVQNKRIALINAFIAGFIPIFFKQTINTVSVSSLTIPLIFLLLFALITIDKNKNSTLLFLASLILLLFTHPLVLLLILGLLFYLILIRAINLKQSKVELEVILFSTFIVFWFLLLLFKKAFLAHGFHTIWQNTPDKILTDYFFDIGILESIYAIGIIPFIFGVYIIYKYILKKRKRPLYIFAGMAIVSFILLWFKLIKPSDSLIILGLSLVVLSSQFYSDFLIFISKTKLHFKNFYIFFLILAVILTSFLPSISYAMGEIENSLTDKEKAALLWIKGNTPENSTVLSLYKEGHLITAIAERKNFIDQNFLLVRNINQKFEDHEVMYTSGFYTNAIRLLTKYEIDYIYFSPKTKKTFNIEEIGYIYDECFPLVYDGEIKIYKVACII